MKKSAMTRTASSKPHAASMLIGALLATAGALAAAAPPGLPKLDQLAPLALHYGANAIGNFTADGRAASIDMAHRENGNAHSYDLLLVTVNGARTGPASARLPGIVDVEQPGTATADVIRIEPFDGENEISALRFARARIDGVPAMLLLEAKRHVENASALTDPTPVELRVWRLDGPSDLAGRTPYLFRLAGAATTAQRYCNATTALNKELGLPFPDGWDNEDTPDGCLPAAAQQRNHAAADMLRTLDVTSFPNSLGPGRRAGAHTLAQYGFTDTRLHADGWAYAEKGDHSWGFGIFVLENGAARKLLCVTDQAENGGTYRSATAVDVVLGTTGLWTASGVREHVPGCG